MNQLITINKDGSMQSLDFKKKGVDLRKLGKVEIERASLIEWDSEMQMWYICFKQDGHNYKAEEKLTSCHLPDSSEVKILVNKYDEKGVCFWDEYEEAVVAEVAYIQWDKVAQ